MSFCPHIPFCLKFQIKIKSLPFQIKIKNKITLLLAYSLPALRQTLARILFIITQIRNECSLFISSSSFAALQFAKLIKAQDSYFSSTVCLRIQIICVKRTKGLHRHVIYVVLLMSCLNIHIIYHHFTENLLFIKQRVFFS